jgi:hypothetical protein
MKKTGISGDIVIKIIWFRETDAPIVGAGSNIIYGQ